jgi:hypothetical protein
MSLFSKVGKCRAEDELSNIVAGSNITFAAVRTAAAYGRLGRQNSVPILLK